MSVSPQDILTFWFEEHDHEDWYGGKAEFDAVVQERFEDTLHAAEKCELFGWRTSPEGRLAEVIVLDQFSRQLYRGGPKAFANDALALALAQEAVRLELDQEIEASHRSFVYMPYMHSESLVIHEEAVRLFTKNGNEGILKFELAHKETIETFGRYPMRNKALNRTSTNAELAYISSKEGSMF